MAIDLYTGGFKGGRTPSSSPPSGIQPPSDPKGPPLYYLEISIFGDEL